MLVDIKIKDIIQPIYDFTEDGTTNPYMHDCEVITLAPTHTRTSIKFHKNSLANFPH